MLWNLKLFECSLWNKLIIIKWWWWWWWQSLKGCKVKVLPFFDIHSVDDQCWIRLIGIIICINWWKKNKPGKANWFIILVILNNEQVNTITINTEWKKMSRINWRWWWWLGMNRAHTHTKKNLNPSKQIWKINDDSQAKDKMNEKFD